ncbi:MAG: hypothetical protein HDS79_02650 [Bacteroidales bacterium]|nr:hypothetical protein [Bacteroidales bacterium]MDE7465716.1 hypothetical protein [Muribaculaceae bacterium]
MKTWSAAILGLGLLIGTGGCTQSQKSPINNIGVPSPADSLLYFYGLTEGAEYWRKASIDTIMTSRHERDRYLKGLRDGLNAVAEVNDTYNRGLQEGINLALSLYAYNEIYDVKLDRDLLYQSIAYALLNDSVVTMAEAADGFRDVLERMNLRKRRKEVAEMHLTLKAEAARLDYKKVSEDLYAKDVRVGSGDSIRRGDIVFFNIEYTLEDGTNLLMPTPEQLRAGSPTMAPVISEILYSLRDGGSGYYLTTAYALFGDRYQTLELTRNQVILLNVQISEVKRVTSPEKAAELAI